MEINKPALLAFVATTLFSINSHADNNFSFEASYLNRSDAGSNLSQNTGTGEIMSGKDADLGNELGFTVSVGGETSDGERLIGSFSYYGKWNSNDELVDVAQRIDPIDEVSASDDDFTDAYLHGIDYESRFWGLELTKTKHLNTTSATAFYGLSYLDLDEKFTWITLDSPGLVPGNNGYGVYDVKTENKLFGLVVGINAGRKIGTSSSVLGDLKLGLYANRAKQTSYFENDGTGGDIGNGSESDWKLAGLIQGKVGIEFTPGRDTKLSVGYQAIYLNGVALAPEQITFGNEAIGAALNNRLSDIETDDILLHGPFVRLSMDF